MGWSNAQVWAVLFLPIFLVVWVVLLVGLLAVAPCSAGSSCFQAFFAFGAALPVAAVVDWALLLLLRREPVDE